MKPFLDDNFLLTNDTAMSLYHDVARDLSIIDYHNHLPAHDVVENRQFDNIAQLWVLNDPYKHRAMRIHGIPEHYITGAASDKEKFKHWAATVPYTLGNPLFHWTALELKRVFDIEEILCPDSADTIWNQCNERLQDESFRAASLLKRWKVETLCTSDDLLDDFSAHQLAVQHKLGFTLLPSLRGDSVLALDQDAFRHWLENLQQITGRNIGNLADFKMAINERLLVMEKLGCVAADHALDNGFSFCEPSVSQAESIFHRLQQGDDILKEDFCDIKSTILHLLGVEYSEYDWLMLLHIGAERYTNSFLREKVGPAGGYAGMGDSVKIKDVCVFMDSLEREQKLPRTALFNLNPMDNAAFATLTGSYAQDGVPGKVQFGPAWWYNDHKDGIEKQLIALANHGLLFHFIGMTTDSRSILSFSRHEYFRRLFCNLLGSWVEAGEAPNDEHLLTEIVRNVCYLNAKKALQKKESK